MVVYFKHYPLDTECNGFIEKTQHVDACKIAGFAICAEKAGFFWDLIDLFFATDKYFMENLKEALQGLGADFNGFLRCSRDPSSLQRLRSDIGEAKRHGVEVIPTVFINGSPIVGSLDPLALSLIVEHFLTQNGAR